MFFTYGHPKVLYSRIFASCTRWT